MLSSASIQLAIHEREYTKTILNTVIKPLVVLDPGLRVLTGNRAFYAMFEVSRDDAHGVRLCNLGDPDWDIARLQTLVNACFTNGEPAALEIEHVFPALGPRTVLLNARRLSGEGKPGQSVLVAVQDITARKRAEEGLREADRRKDEFLATLAHELRNPLAPIRNSLAILQLAGGLGPAAERIREIMDQFNFQFAGQQAEVCELLQVTRCARRH